MAAGLQTNDLIVNMSH